MTPVRRGRPNPRARGLRSFIKSPSAALTARWRSEPAHSGEGRRLDLDGEMAFAAAVVAGMAAMLRAVVDHCQPGRRKRGTEAFFDFPGDRAG